MAKNQELKNLLNKIKYEKDLTQAEVAQLVGVGKTYMSDMLNGRVPYSDNMKEKLEKLLEHNTVIGNENIVGNISSSIDARKYYSDSPDVLKQQISQLEQTIQDKEDQVRTLTDQVRTLTDQVRTLTSSLAKKDEQISKLIDKIK